MAVPRPADKGTTPSSAQPADASAPQAASGVVHRGLNKNLQFTHRDDQPIPLPSAASAARHGGSLVQLIDADRTLFPWGTYRYIDYFLCAVDLFLKEVVGDFRKQQAMAATNGREYKRFTWSNKGDLAITFALACDMLKMLFAKITSGPTKPKWDTFVDEFIHLLIRKSQIPGDILQETTYRTKYLDWKKGGTRYQSTDSSNVRFPSAEERLKKLETYVKSGADYEVQSTVVPVVETTAATAASAPPVELPAPTRGADSGVAQPPAATPTAAVLVGPRHKMPPSGIAAVKQPHQIPPSNVAQDAAVLWLKQFNAVKGNPQLMLLTRDHLHKMPQVVLLCRNASHPDQYNLVAELIANSPLEVQQAFESRGGLILVKQWVSRALQTPKSAGDTVRLIVERVGQLKLRSWGPQTRAAWLNGAANLDWLRAVEVPLLTPQQWNSAVSVLEALAHSKNSETNPSSQPNALFARGSAMPPVKRAREGDEEPPASDTAVRTVESSAAAAAMSPTVTAPSRTSLVAPIPEHLRIPEGVGAVAHADAAVAATTQLQDLLRSRREFIDNHVAEIGSRLPKTFDLSSVQTIFYNPFELLGISDASIQSWL